MPTRFILYRLSDGGYAACVEKTDEAGEKTTWQWVEHRNDGARPLDNIPPDLVGPPTIIDLPEFAT
jgi:hypothetical protein